MNPAPFVGIDLAWGTRGRTGLAVVDDAGRLVSSASAGSDEEIDAWLAVHAPHPTVVAVDAPLVVTNASGMRECERAVGRAYARYRASCHVTNRSLPWMDPPRAAGLAARHGWSDDLGGAAPLCFETYPHAVLVGLFALPRSLRYKRGPFADRRIAFGALLDHVESLGPLGLATDDRWQDLRAVVAGATGGRHLDSVEDEVDAIVCAHVAWLWARRRTALHVYGDVGTGCIVAPPPPTHPAAPRG